MIRTGRAVDDGIDWLVLARQQSDRFWAKVDKSGDCWIWKAGLDKDGYGKFAITAPPGVRPKQRHVRAHRLAWELIHGRSFPSGKISMHSCDTPGCVRHVRPGTQAKNREDCVARGRQPRGSASPKAKLSEQQVRAIKRRVKTERRTTLADEYGVSVQTVHAIVSGRNWGWV